MNTILTDKYREQYVETIDHLKKMCPEMMSRKINEANVQQAFTYSKTKEVAKKGDLILSVGCFEDTAYETLKIEGYNVTGIDPAVNYSLEEFYKNVDVPFNIIFSTSVIEHVEDDETFLDQICKMLAPNGYGILTCDFKNGWHKGDPLPGEDARLYTEYDLLVRLHKILKANNCNLIGVPDYDYPTDFDYGVHHYSFATYTFQKNG